MQYAQLQDDVLVTLSYNEEFFAADAWHSYGNLVSMSVAEKQALGVYACPQRPATPYGKQPTLSTPVLDGDQVVWVIDYQDIPLSDLKAEKLSDLANIRWHHCQSFVYDGTVAPADPALTAVTGAVVAAQIVPSNGTTTWKLAPGQFRQWNTAQIVAYGIAIRTHVQACFDKEEALSEEINAATDADDLAAIDIETGWPT